MLLQSPGLRFSHKDLREVYFTPMNFDGKARTRSERFHEEQETQTPAAPGGAPPQPRRSGRKDGRGSGSRRVAVTRQEDDGPVLARPRLSLLAFRPRHDLKPLSAGAGQESERHEKIRKERIGIRASDRYHVRRTGVIVDSHRGNTKWRSGN